MPTPDFNLSNEGSLFLLAALTPEADDWCEAHLPSDRLLYAGCVVIEPRFVENIVEGIHADELTIA